MFVFLYANLYSFWSSAADRKWNYQAKKTNIGICWKLPYSTDFRMIAYGRYGTSLVHVHILPMLSIGLDPNLCSSSRHTCLLLTIAFYLSLGLAKFPCG
jgi:hypothetical protein